jgi:hypothetical protein
MVHTVPCTVHAPRESIRLDSATTLTGLAYEVLLRQRCATTFDPRSNVEVSERLCQPGGKREHYIKNKVRLCCYCGFTFVCKTLVGAAFQAHCLVLQ